MRPGTKGVALAPSWRGARWLLVSLAAAIEKIAERMDVEAHEEVIAERVARNDATFRAANEQIKEKAEELQIDRLVPFLCECADPNCREIVTLPLGEYRDVRADSRHFLKLPGHERAAQGFAIVIAERDGYVIAEKVGRAGELAEEYDLDRDEQA